MSGTTPEGHSPLTPVVFHILLALTDGALHGYAIMRRVEAESGLEMGPGTVYGSLGRLEEAGLVQETESDPEGDPRRGRSFELTAAGRETLGLEALRLDRLARLARERRLVEES